IFDFAISCNHSGNDIIFVSTLILRSYVFNTIIANIPFLSGRKFYRKRPVKETVQKVLKDTT
ncbi:MAG: hypothetical protein R6V72_19685, partial [Cyclobacterium sp.]|uniref:hypothetical protein n=1 Tax=Cyclobacterium sp. TaxID=1966343 RepID=UPI00397106E2